ncbi:MAG: PspC domain-containing protein [Flavobacteriales bacterium]
MKKTVTANIAGTVFHIEEDAYEQLQRYLAGIRANFSGSAGADEIMADIESRIAELFTERLTGRNVVNIADVQNVEGVMGRPEDFAGEGDGDRTTAGAGTTAQATSGPRRFMRDPDDKWMGGVLGGLASYIGMDPLWLRIGFIVLIYFSIGSLIPIYVLLWILVPKAETAAEKLQMRGEPVTVENIKRVVEEGGEHLKQGAQRAANEAKEFGRDFGPKATAWGHEAGRNAGAVGRNAAHILRKLVGVGFIVLAFTLLLGLITGLIGGSISLWHFTWSSADMGLLDLGGLIFNSQSHALWFGIGVLVLVTVPLIGLFLAGFRLLLDTRTPKWLGWTLSILWFAALVPTVIAGAELASDFHRENSVRTEETLKQPQGDILYLDALNPADETEGWSVRFDNGAVDVDMDGLHVENGNIFGAWAQLDVERSADSLFHLQVVREAHGGTAKAALARAEEIQFRVEQNGDVLLVSPVLSYAMTDKFRLQNVQFTLEVPLGKSVFFRPASRYVIYDIDNVTNEIDRDMIGRTWTMTPRGLEDLTVPHRMKQEEEEVAPKDSTRKGPVAAVVWQGPSKRRPAQEHRPPARAEGTTNMMPNLLQLLRPRI